MSHSGFFSNTFGLKILTGHVFFILSVTCSIAQIISEFLLTTQQQAAQMFPQRFDDNMLSTKLTGT